MMKMSQLCPSYCCVHGTNTSRHVFPGRPSASHPTSMYRGRTPLALSSLAGPVLHIAHLCTGDEHLSPCLPWQAQCFTSHIYVQGTNTSRHVFPGRPSASHHTGDEHLSPCLPWQAQCFTSHIYVHPESEISSHLSVM